MNKLQKIIIEPYNSEWPKKFIKEKENLLQAIAMSVAIEHVGSTSVHGLAAKPTIDILIGIKDLSEVTPDQTRL